MKKLTTVVATLALALPLTATPFVGATSASAATATPKTTHPLDKVSHFRATSVHVKHTTTLTTIQFAADRASATTTPAKTKIAPKTTYTATKTIILTTGKHATTAYTLISKHGKVLGWVKTVDLTKPVTHPKATTKPTPKRNAKHATNKRTPARKVAPTAKKISLVAKHPKTSIKATTKATHPKANKTVTKVTKRAPKLTIKPASSTKTAEKAIQKTTKKVTRKATKKANRQAAKNVTKKVTKKVAPKVTSKATKKAAPKTTKKVTKLAAKKHSPLKPTAAHPTHKTSIKASAKL
ncbi:hypothetical protein [Lactiplantibacillus pentosus]|uniref:hypothetical protein n=1 Tax=Lactiplantibacillus pentosus TaxID=1589 RepID=UPI0021A79AD4|nr:hypothetical protein [Lactiplantibacillus pentosus]